MLIHFNLFNKSFLSLLGTYIYNKTQLFIMPISQLAHMMLAGTLEIDTPPLIW